MNYFMYCLCQVYSHGQYLLHSYTCYMLTLCMIGPGVILNDETVHQLCKQAVAQV